MGLDDATLVDLHTHTTFSDGSLSPVEMIERAQRHGVGVLSITDHDTVAAYEQPYEGKTLVEYARERGIELVPGVEVSASFEGGGVHILGLFIQPDSGVLKELLRRQQGFRKTYAKEVIAKLQSGGWQFEASEELAQGDSVTKAHIAGAIVSCEANKQQLLSVFGEVPTRGAFIEAMMNEGFAYFVEKQALLPDEVIDAIHRSGGLAVLAHPVAYLYEGMTKEAVISLLSSYKFDGIEAFYYYHDQTNWGIKIDAIDQLMSLARDKELAVSMGSDYHGPSPHHGAQVEVGFYNFDRKPAAQEFARLKALVLK